MKKQKQNQESVAHFVTVIGCFMDNANTTVEAAAHDYEKAIQYTLEFIKYRFDENNIK